MTPTDKEIQKAAKFLGELANQGAPTFSHNTADKILRIQELLFALLAQRGALIELINSHTTDLTKMRIALIQDTKDIL
jgi:hypothetical protein